MSRATFSVIALNVSMSTAPLRVPGGLEGDMRGGGWCASPPRVPLGLSGATGPGCVKSPITTQDHFKGTIGPRSSVPGCFLAEDASLLGPQAHH
jgi:hypothetical protein